MTYEYDFTCINQSSVLCGHSINVITYNMFFDNKNVILWATCKGKDEIWNMNWTSWTNKNKK